MASSSIREDGLLFSTAPEPPKPPSDPLAEIAAALQNNDQCKYFYLAAVSEGTFHPSLAESIKVDLSANNRKVVELTSGEARIHHLGFVGVVRLPDPTGLLYATVTYKYPDAIETYKGWTHLSEGQYFGGGHGRRPDSDPNALDVGMVAKKDSDELLRFAFDYEVKLPKCESLKPGLTLVYGTNTTRGFPAAKPVAF